MQATLNPHISFPDSILNSNRALKLVSRLIKKVIDLCTIANTYWFSDHILRM